MAKTNYQSVDEYIGMQAVDQQAALEELRQFIRSQIPPTAQEGISYQIPMYKYQGSLVGFASYEKHYSFVTANASTLEQFRAELKGYKFSPSAIQLPYGKPLPTELLGRIIQQRIVENEGLATKKKQK
ncbi:MAG: DUF1801 domain-containing protein [Haliscomenobacter sp.]|uniref:iron chaperone n=1 Tax=Haliscomenobacter sp. TaxID=2717303 RepID=UPI0029B64F5D|nr:DUF1801 domain-containing protein [Haliscomenobacter sp.]MDX2071426.1 DUF1801 domain-containing protein [Haliscomenobacter sp.]